MTRCKRSEKPWERQPKESAKAFEAFEIYCQMGTERSIQKVAQKLTKSTTLLKRWSSQWDWQERCRAYDNERKRLEIAQEKKNIKKMQERQIQMAVLLQKKALQALDKIDIEDLPPRDILRFMTEGAKLEKQTRMEGSTSLGEEAEKAKNLADVITEAWEKRKD